MTAVLVHGVPETGAVWDALREQLDRDDVVAVSLPGFGRPLPPGFEPTMDAYVDWLIAELSALPGPGPVDLVGHDWGGGFTLRLVSLRPDLVRSWVTDAAGLADTTFQWHQFATIWQSPGDGEAFMEGWLAQSADERAGLFTSAGAQPDRAMALAAAFDRTMADAILTLYRSATQVNEAWGPAFVDIPKPGLAIVPLDDPFLEARGATRAAERAGAEVARLEGRGHWWMLEDPAGAARMLESFWSSAAN